MIVYLDQCAISKLALDHEKDPSTAKLRELLIKGKDQGRILCPLPHETIVESLSLPETERRMVYDLQTHLAAFDENKQVLCAFKTIWKMINEETLAIARDLQPPRPFEFVRWRLPASEDQARKSVEGIENAKSIMTARFDSLAMGGIQQLSDYNEALDLVVHEHASHLLRQIERLSQGEAPSPADHCAYDLASYLVEAQITSD